MENSFYCLFSTMEYPQEEEFSLAKIVAESLIMVLFLKK